MKKNTYKASYKYFEVTQQNPIISQQLLRKKISSVKWNQCLPIQSSRSWVVSIPYWDGNHSDEDHYTDKIK